MTSNVPIRVPLAFLAALAVAACGESAAPKPAPAAPPAPAPAAPMVPVKKAADWCAEHGVPESVCTRCNVELVAVFKQKGDWCEEHGLPKSQCVACDPSLAEKLKALAPVDAK